MKINIYTIIMLISINIFPKTLFKNIIKIKEPHSFIKYTPKIYNPINPKMIMEGNKAHLFLKSITDKKSKIKSIIINAKIDIRKKYIRLKGNMLIYMISPDKILIKTYILGFNISTLLINGNKLYFRDNIKNTLKIRKATKNNISRYIPIKLSLKQFKNMLKGAPPTINYNKIKINKEKNKLILKNDYEIQYLTFNNNQEIIEMNLFQNGKRRIDIKFLNLKYENGYNYASKIIFNDYKKKIKSKMKIISIKFNIKINNKIFLKLN